MKQDITKIYNANDKILQAIARDPEIISLKTAKERAYNAEKNGDIPHNMGDFFAWVIADLSLEHDLMGVGETMDDVDEAYSLQELLQTQYNTILETKFNELQQITNMPIRNYQNATYESIIAYAREMSRIGEDGNLYTIKDATGVDILGGILERYYSANKETFDKKRPPMPEDVCDYIESIGYMADRESFLDGSTKNIEDVLDDNNYEDKLEK